MIAAAVTGPTSGSDSKRRLVRGVEVDQAGHRRRRWSAAEASGTGPRGRPRRPDHDLLTVGEHPREVEAAEIDPGPGTARRPQRVDDAGALPEHRDARTAHLAGHVDDHLGRPGAAGARGTGRRGRGAAGRRRGGRQPRVAAWTRSGARPPRDPRCAPATSRSGRAPPPRAPPPRPPGPAPAGPARAGPRARGPTRRSPATPRRVPAGQPHGRRGRAGPHDRPGLLVGLLGDRTLVVGPSRLVEVGHRADPGMALRPPRGGRPLAGLGARPLLAHGGELGGQQLQTTGDGGVVLGGGEIELRMPGTLGTRAPGSGPVERTLWTERASRRPVDDLRAHVRPRRPALGQSSPASRGATQTATIPGPTCAPRTAPSSPHQTSRPGQVRPRAARPAGRRARRPARGWPGGRRTGRPGGLRPPSTMRSSIRLRARAEVRTRSRFTTRPSSIRSSGFTERAPPRMAAAAPIRPPRRRYSRVST